MKLVDYEPDVEDEHNNGLRMSNGNAKGGVGIAQDQPFGSRRETVTQPTNTTAFPRMSHGSDHSAGMSDPMFIKGDVWRKTPGEVNITEMVIGGVKRKVISMEEAIERGFICKKKLESWQKQNLNDVHDTPSTVHNDVRDSPRTIQEVPPNAKSIGIKRPVSPTRLFPSPQPHAIIQAYTQLPLQDLDVIHVCEECNVPCSGLVNLQMHYQGKKHKARIEELKRGYYDLNTKTGPLKCNVCNIPCMNERNLQEHLAGKKHAACLLAFNMASKGNRAE